MILRHVYFWWRHHGRFNRQLRPIVVHYDCRRRDLLQGCFRRVSFGSRHHVTIAPSSATAYDFLRNLQSIRVRRRCYERYCLPSLALRDLMTDKDSTDQEADDRNMDDRRNSHSVRAIVVVLSPDLFGLLRKARTQLGRRTRLRSPSMDQSGPRHPHKRALHCRRNFDDSTLTAPHRLTRC